MESKELRKGNFVKYIYSDKEFSVVDGFDSEYVFLNEITADYAEHSEVEPIPLAEEWLVKFGFINDGRYLRIDKVKITFRNGCWRFEFGGVKVMLRHVHQLQNLYFALTGEELIIKL